MIKRAGKKFHTKRTEKNFTVERTFHKRKKSFTVGEKFHKWEKR